MAFFFNDNNNGWLSTKNEKTIQGFLKLNYSKSILDEIIKKPTTNKNKDYLIKTISYSAINYNDISLLNLKIEILETIWRHHSLSQNLIYLFPLFQKHYGFKKVKDYYLAIAKQIRYFEKNNKAYFIGLFESHSLPIQYFLKSGDELMELLNKIGFTKESPYTIKELKLKTNDTYILKQLTTRLEMLNEGVKMNHCIGGRPLNKKTIHFSLINKKHNERTSFSLLYDTKTEEFILEEAKNKRNTTVSNHNVSIINQILQLVNENYKQYLVDIMIKNGINLKHKKNSIYDEPYPYHPDNENFF